MKMKKKIIVVVVIGVLLMLIGIFLYENDSIRFKLSYEYINQVEYNNGKKIKVNIPWKNGIQYLSEEEIIPFLKGKTGIIYFGYNTCPWCRNIVPILIDTVQDNHIDTLYYVDIHKVDLSSIKNELISLLDEYLEENETGEKGIAVPDVYFIKEGKIIGHHLGTVDSYHNPYLGMSPDQKQELTNIYQDFIEEMKK